METLFLSIAILSAIGFIFYYLLKKKTKKKEQTKAIAPIAFKVSEDKPNE